MSVCECANIFTSLSLTMTNDDSKKRPRTLCARTSVYVCVFVCVLVCEFRKARRERKRESERGSERE